MIIYYRLVWMRPQRACSKDESLLNMLIMLITVDKLNLETSVLNYDAPKNIPYMSVALDTTHLVRPPIFIRSGK